MSYRRNRDLVPGSSAWRLRHRQRLLECGIPDAVLASDRSLTYLLLHGDDELGSGWRCSQLGQRQAVALLRFLEAQLVPGDGYDILPQLRRRCASAESFREPTITSTA